MTDATSVIGTLPRVDMEICWDEGGSLPPCVRSTPSYQFGFEGVGQETPGEHSQAWVEVWMNDSSFTTWKLIKHVVESTEPIPRECVPGVMQFFLRKDAPRKSYFLYTTNQEGDPCIILCKKVRFHWELIVQSITHTLRWRSGMHLVVIPRQAE